MHTKKEQIDYVEGQINKSRRLVEDKQSRIAWPTINEVSKNNTYAERSLKESA